MTWVAGLFLVVGFLAIARLLRLVARADEVLARSRAALGDMRDPALSDLEKEQRVQGHASRLMLLFVVLTLGLALALGVPLGIVWLADRVGVVSFDATLDLALSWPFLLIACVVTAAAIPLFKRRRPTEA